MFKRLFLILSIVALTAAIAYPAVTANNGIVGAVTKVDSNSIEVRTDNSSMVISVQVNAHTAYRKWITEKPWQQVAHASDVKVGSRVHVDLGKSDSKTAETVWIVTR